MGLRGQILCGFGVLILVVGALLWLFQIVLLEPFYRTVKTAEVKAAARSGPAPPGFGGTWTTRWSSCA